MTDQEELELLLTQKPDLAAALRALVREEIKKWASARYDGLMREASYIKKYTTLPDESSAGDAKFKV